MKRAMILLLFVLFALSCLPLAGQSYNGTVRAALDEEQVALDRIQQEIDRLSILAGKKVEVKQAYDSGNLASAMRMFEQDAAPMKEFLDNGDYSSALGELIDLIVVYQFIPQLDDQLLFYEGRVYRGYGRLSSSKRRFEELIENYPASPRVPEAVFLLQEIYFLTEASEELIALTDQYPDDLLPRQKFWLGNAYMNVDRIPEAEEIFTSLLSDPDFGFKAEALLALSSYYSYGLDYAIEKFLTLIIDYPEESADFDFVYLSLGRLYQERADYAKAIYCYEEYMALTDNQLSDAFYYELVLLYLQMEDYDTAMGYLSELLNDPYETEYYNSPNYLSAIVNYQQGSLNDAKTDINLALEDTYLMVDVLDTKRELIQRHRDLMDRYNQSVTLNAREDAREDIVQLNDQIISTTGTLEDVAVGLSPDDVIRLQIYEEEFALVNDTIEQVRLLIDLANSRPNKKIPARIDGWTEDLDNYHVQVKTLHYLSNLDQVKMGDYELAYALASEIHKTGMLINTWKQVSADPNTRPDVRTRAREAVSLMEQNLQSLETVALYAFGELRAETELQRTLAAEQERLTAFRQEMLQVRERSVRDYNRQVAKRLGQVNLLLLDENQGLREKYVDVLAALEQDVTQVSSRYEYTLLDILYDETVQMDDQFQQLQAEYRAQTSPPVQEKPAPEPVDVSPESTEGAGE